MYFRGTVFGPGNMLRMLTGALAPDKPELESKTGSPGCAFQPEAGAHLRFREIVIVR
jgi:hypothetical protein